MKFIVKETLKKVFDVNYNNQLISLLKTNSHKMENLFIDILLILQKYPPAKNENKFIYGKVAEKRLISWFNTFIPCEELDKGQKCGSEYKNDCEISFPNKIKYSIKVSKSGAAPTLINKRNITKHNIDGCRFIICHILNKKLYIFTHTSEFDQYVEETSESIRYKSKIFKFLDKNDKYYYEFPKSDVIDTYVNEFIKDIDTEDIYEKIALEIDSINKKYYN